MTSKPQVGRKEILLICTIPFVPRLICRPDEASASPQAWAGPTTQAKHEGVVHILILRLSSQLAAFSVRKFQSYHKAEIPTIAVTHHLI